MPLLAYCLQDLDLSTGPNGAWLQQVVGLRLLPLADGQGLAAFEAPEQASRPQQLVFVVTDAVEQALVHTERKSRGCAESLSQCRAGWQCPCDSINYAALLATSCPAKHDCDSEHIPASSSAIHHTLLHVLGCSAGGLLLDTELVGPALTTQLSLLASFDSCSVKHLTVVHLVDTFLPRLLPAAWRHAPVVCWGAPAAAAAGDSTPHVSW